MDAYELGRRMHSPDSAHGPKHLRVAFDEFEYGLVYRRMREDTDEHHPMWTVGRVCLWPNGFFLGDHFEWRVPIDDEHTLSIAWMFDRVPNEQEPFVQDNIPTWRAPIKDPGSGRWITSHVMNQDFVAWVGTGHNRRSHTRASGKERPRRRDAAKAIDERSESDYGRP
jgi:5,5'-dehydrodivanillate O-demethylase